MEFGQYLVAVAIPTSSVAQQRVYMAFNFEAHYGLANSDTFLDKFNHKVRRDNKFQFLYLSNGIVNTLQNKK